MTALDAYREQARTARWECVRKLEAIAHEYQHQAARVAAGDHYDDTPVAHRLAAVDEALDLLNAHNTNVHGLRLAADSGAHRPQHVRGNPTTVTGWLPLCSMTTERQPA